MLTEIAEDLRDLLPTLESLFSGGLDVGQMFLLDFLEASSVLHHTPVMSIAEAIGPDGLYLERLIGNYLWPQWHQQHLESGGAYDKFFAADSMLLMIVLLDAGRAEECVQKQLGVIGQVLECPEIDGQVIWVATIGMARLSMRWPDRPPIHATVLSRMQQLARDKFSGFADMDVWPGLHNLDVRASISFPPWKVSCPNKTGCVPTVFYS